MGVETENLVGDGFVGFTAVEIPVTATGGAF